MTTSAAQHTTSLALVILMVADPRASADFYREVLGMAPAESSPTFAMFALPSGTGLGLWSRTTTAPPVSAAAGASELCFIEQDVDAVHADWLARGIPIAQAPTDMDFGRTFVALDPDGHRLRVFRPAPEEAHV
jgi:catechol 2,3-dioxygenase-like lactoylglutathione lyase family enzyme